MALGGLVVVVEGGEEEEQRGSFASYYPSPAGPV